MITALEKITIQAIVNVFETGSPAGDYSNITVAPGDPGHLTYGRSQTTLSSGNLALLVKSYCNSTSAAHSVELIAYLPRLEARDTTLDSDARLKILLRQAAADRAMRCVQDDFFDRSYWLPALHASQALAIESPLGTAVVYDSFIHGAWARLRDATVARIGRPSASSLYPQVPGEGAWVRQYIALRRDWLANHSNPLLRRAVYRMDTFRSLADSGNWDLHLPLTAHDVVIREADLPQLADNPPLDQASQYNQSASKLNSRS